jgi:excisionase family DNA binding protein
MTDIDGDLARAKAAFDAAPEPGEQKPPAPQKKKAKKAKKRGGDGSNQHKRANASQEALISQSDAAETPAPAPPPVFGDEILTIDGTAAFLKVSRRQIYLMLKNEELPARRVGKRWRFSKAALSAYVSGRE